MRRDARLYIIDILESIEAIEEYTKEIDKNHLEADKLTQDAVLRRLEIIGEAAKNIPSNITDKYPQIPWKKISGLRDVLIHSYFGVNIERIWRVIADDLQSLKEATHRMKKEIDSKE